MGMSRVRGGANGWGSGEKIGGVDGQADGWGGEWCRWMCGQTGVGEDGGREAR